jgi:hypothetical protein
VQGSGPDHVSARRKGGQRFRQCLGEASGARRRLEEGHNGTRPRRGQVAGERNLIGAITIDMLHETGHLSQSSCHGGRETAAPGDDRIPPVPRRHQQGLQHAKLPDGIDERGRQLLAIVSAGVNGLRIDEANREAADASVELIDVVRVGAHPETGRKTLASGRLSGSRRLVVERRELRTGHTPTLSDRFCRLVHHVVFESGSGIATDEASPTILRQVD